MTKDELIIETAFPAYNFKGTFEDFFKLNGITVESTERNHATIYKISLKGSHESLTFESANAEKHAFADAAMMFMTLQEIAYVLKANGRTFTVSKTAE